MQETWNGAPGSNCPRLHRQNGRTAEDVARLNPTGLLMPRPAPTLNVCWTLGYSDTRQAEAASSVLSMSSTVEYVSCSRASGCAGTTTTGRGSRRASSPSRSSSAATASRPCAGARRPAPRTPRASVRSSAGARRPPRRRDAPRPASDLDANSGGGLNPGPPARFCAGMTGLFRGRKRR